LGITAENVEIAALAAAVEAAPQRKLQVLAAEDNPVFRSMLGAMLNKWGYEAVMARDGKEAWEVLQKPDPPRLAILDWMMPGLDGVEVCRLVRAAAREPYIYILLLTARTDSTDLVEGMDAGSDDYLTKPFNSHELRARLRAGERILDLQQQLLQAREALREQAMHDGLTGLLNRRSILEVLRNELARASRENKPLAVLIADLDRFKQINDTAGHLAGDAVLRETARRMKQALRRYDSVGRYGGEEFLMVLPGSGVAEAESLAERVRQAMCGEPFDLGESRLSVTCSIGVAHRGEGGEDPDSLIREADVAMYRAKEGGRNCVMAWN